MTRQLTQPTSGAAPAFALAFAALLALPVSAEEPPAPEGLSPPELTEAAPALYPDEARKHRLNAVVVLRLTIDVEGRVVQSEVLEPAGHGFDDAARGASLTFRFKPALRNGLPVQARIRYAIEFEYVEMPEDTHVRVAPEPTHGAGQAAPSSAVPPAVVPPPVASGPAELDVKVRGHKSAAHRLQRSAEAVNVVDTRRAKRETADLGEVLARTQGVAIRRDGGLGSRSRFSLNGLYDDQIRFFVDGVPLPFAGFPFGIVNVPVNLTERVEIYRGVVPLRFGADALGGAVNVVTEQSLRSRATASYQTGSFGMHRLTLTGRHYAPESGFVAQLTSFLDATQNNYDIDVIVSDARGGFSSATVPRFHDAYRAYGLTLEAGVVERPWAKRLLLKGFYSGYHKEHPHNLIMKVPYGEVSYGERVAGVTARYDVALARKLELALVGNYSHRTIDFDDHGEWIYDWFGQRTHARRAPGELDTDEPSDQTEWQNAGFGRASLRWAFGPGHVVRASVTPTYATRTGDERLQPSPTARDPLTAEREQFTLVSGVEYELDAESAGLSNIVFVKDYVYGANTEELLPGGIFRKRERDVHRVGVGDSLRFRFTRWLMLKASYEYATRLPRPDEVFGDGILIHENVELLPEVSHNANAGPRVELHNPHFGDVVVDVNLFLRASDELIVLLGNDRYYTYQNVYRARALGVENALSWQSANRVLALDGALTWQDVRNASNDGTFERFEGDRLPNRPYLFASFGGRLRFGHLPEPADTLEPFYHGRYVHEFFRSWESLGERDSKHVIDSQLTHAAGVTYSVDRDAARVSSTFEIDNFTNAKVFDNFGVQRPGRAFYIKMSGEI